jgi:pantoate--beta-alanine ligase
MKPQIISDPKALYAACEAARKKGARVGLVPTMGALHRGHLSLVTLMQARADFSVVSIFVNPTQFGPNEDFDRYPRTLDADVEKLSSKQVNAVFAPASKDMYPDGFSTEISVSGVTEGLCGDLRPGHFNGAALVVTKLFCATGPCVAAFGRKDYQQLQVIKRLTADLNLPVEILEGPTFREADGVALSSRNNYLCDEDRLRARAIPRGLSAAHGRFASGERSVSALLTAVSSEIAPAVDAVEYITAADSCTLRPVCTSETAPEQLLIAVAVRLGGTRLIDNIVLGEDAPPIL